VAEALAQGLSEAEAPVALTDLAGAGSLDASLGTEPDCLLIGSPVYFNRAVPPVLAFIEGLPSSEGKWAAPFVTYGKACSGLALWQMASALRTKGYRIAGAMKVQAVHSLMWDSKDPVGGGHPDGEELNQVRDFAEELYRRFRQGALRELDLQALDYHREELRGELQAALEKPWPIMPKAVHGPMCTECGVCADECPVLTITLNPLPEFGDECIDCFNCVRLCPEEAITPETSLAEIGEMVRRRMLMVDETPLTEAFLPPLP
jgi:ferredoxin